MSIHRRTIGRLPGRPALLPHWLATKTTDGVVGNLTGVLAEVGIGAALLAVGFARRRQNR